MDKVRVHEVVHEVNQQVEQCRVAAVVAAVVVAARGREKQPQQRQQGGTHARERAPAERQRERERAIYTYIYIYMLLYADPPRRHREVPRFFHQSSYVFLVYDLGVTLGFEAPRGEHIYISSRLHAQFLATLHPDTPKDDFSNDESHFWLNTRSSIWGRVLTPKMAFTVVPDQSPSNTYESP